MNSTEKLTVNTVRTLIMDAIQKANSGHPGLAIDAAPMALALFETMKHNPKNPQWKGRDRFVLSSGHASMLEYAMLHIFGYDVSMEDIKQFRQFGSKTAGHPEYRNIPGIEATTGPLGQGFAMAVGMAMAEKHLAAVYNRENFKIINNYTYVLMGDGCIMEGSTSEAASLAGNLKLGKLIALYDSNRITIEGDTDITFTDNTEARFTSYGWQVINVEDGENIDAVKAALAIAKNTEDKPKLIIVRTNIAQGTAKQGSASSHGSPLGEENIAAFKSSIGWEYEPFTVPGEVKEFAQQFNKKNEEREEAYNAMVKEYSVRFPELYNELTERFNTDFDVALNDDSLYEFEDKKIATRACSGMVLNKLAAKFPALFGGSADLAPSNKTELKNYGFFSDKTPDGRNVHFGVREFAMAAACNGMALYGGMLPYCATFLVFSDYLKPALRLSALMKLKVIYVLTHDSIGVGEDGPTHQPIEQLDMLRSIPDTYVFRPADGRETAVAYISALKLNAPSVMALSRQNLPQIEGTGKNALRGGYVLRDCEGTPDAIIMASGSEVETAVNAYELLKTENAGLKVRVVSMPCMELFDKQDEEYRESVLPDKVRTRIAVEASAANAWYKYIGLDGKLISMRRFGASAPAGRLFEYFGFTAEKVAETVASMVH